MSEHTPQFFFYDSTLLDLAFCSYSLGTCALIKNNTLSIFMLSGSIQSILLFQFESNYEVLLNKLSNLVGRSMSIQYIYIFHIQSFMVH